MKWAQGLVVSGYIPEKFFIGLDIPLVVGVSDALSSEFAVTQMDTAFALVEAEPTIDSMTSSFAITSFVIKPAITNLDPSDGYSVPSESMGSSFAITSMSITIAMIDLTEGDYEIPSDSADSQFSIASLDTAFALLEVDPAPSDSMSSTFAITALTITEEI